MKEKLFFMVFARLVEKVIREPVEEDIDFDWRSYFDNDLPAHSQKFCAALAAEDYLAENGFRHRCDPAIVLSVRS